MEEIRAAEGKSLDHYQKKIVLVEHVRTRHNTFSANFGTEVNNRFMCHELGFFVLLYFFDDEVF